MAVRDPLVTTDGKIISELRYKSIMILNWFMSLFEYLGVSIMHYVQVEKGNHSHTPITYRLQKIMNLFQNSEAL